MARGRGPDPPEGTIETIKPYRHEDIHFRHPQHPAARNGHRADPLPALRMELRRRRAGIRLPGHLRLAV